MSNIDKRALREAAERAGQNDWEYVYTSDLSAPGRGYITVGGAEAIYCLNKAAGGVKQSENVLRYIAAASPETMLALLNEIAELEQRHCGTALLEREEMHTKTLGRMLDELDAKDNRINRLEAIVAVAEQRNALMREWKRALKVPCDLVDDQVPVVIHGMVIRLDRLKETEAKLEAAEKWIAELEASHRNLREAMAGIHNTITGGGAYTPLAAILNASKRAYEESAAAAGKGEAS
ncbi:ead/Ea22-like family protein [Enterobacter asburiae]|uniref:ead/Ea22-like family protein n=1 Tax=Enterobacter asburiae TaxID=61645 RepID=UPI0018671E6E|nr:ead/Ea22-like family protein [Enterobacter asburiae]